MKKILLASALAAFASTAYAGDNYVSFTGGYGSGGLKIKGTDADGDINDKLSTHPWAIAAAFGTHITPETRAEFSIGYDQSSKKNSTDEGTVKAKFRTVDLMVNGYYDFKNSTLATPYVMGGLGFASKVNSVYDDEGNNAHAWKGGFGYQLGLGVNFAVADQVALGVGYRFKDTFIKDKTNNITVKTKPTHLGVVQLTYKF